ncbi:MAG: TetR/AcrR family transcriptional regulator [Prevotellaceae bacterium]|jgi:AcrR family transcriptional regulator|nr:TetR/AcrR family transcriptional regulator [Prevotellaceae bacterium]
MPRTKEQNEAIRGAKEQLIVSVALKLFAKNGYTATSIDKIAKEAGISKGLLYNYFTSKENLLYTMINNLIVEFENAIDPNHDGTVTDEEAIGFIDSTFDMLMHRKNEMQLYYQLTLQPQVLGFFTKQVKMYQHLADRQRLIVQYFVKKIPCSDEKAAYLTMIAFLKGLFMVCVFMPEVYPNDFLMQYKAYIKSKLMEAIKNNQ